MGTLAVVAALASAGVGLSGYRGTTPSQARAAAAAEPAGEKDPNAPRLFDRSDPIRIHVAGAVKKPGVYTLPAWARVVDAVKKAGGASGDADLDGINLADFLKDGEQLRIPVRGRRAASTLHPPAPEPPVTSPTRGGHGGGRFPFSGTGRQPGTTARTASAAASGTSHGPLDLNAATRDQLETLPGVGPSTADLIVRYREANGPFVQPEDLMNVRGIGEKKYEKLRGRVVTR